MFPSLSSCTPSTLVTTSFTVKEKQTLVINQPVKVVGANVYYVQQTGGNFEFFMDLGTLVFYTLPVIHCIVGITYRFVIFTLTDETFYITDTAGTEYTAGIRYADSSPYREKFIFFAGPLSNIPVGAATTVILEPTTQPIYTTSVFVRPFGSTVKSFLRPGIDYVEVKVGANSQFTFTVPIANSNVYFTGGGLFALTSNQHTNNYVVRVNGTKLIPFDRYVVDNFYLGLWGVFSTESYITVDFQPGQNGYVYFTPSAATPNILQIRNRKTTNIQATISVTSSGTVFPANTKVELKKYDTVYCSVTTPAAYLGYSYYEYFLGGMQNYFAVVNKNNYNPLVKIGDRLKRFFNYVNYYSSISLMNGVDKEILYVSLTGLGEGSSVGNVNFDNYHVVLDSINSRVNFYTGSGGLHHTVILPDFPIQYEKYRYFSGGEFKTDLAVLAADGRIYRIKNDLTYTTSSQFAPAALSLAFINSNLPINEDIPFFGSYTDAARAKLVGSLFPIVKSFTIIGTSSTAYLAGVNTIAKMNLSTGAVFGSIAVTGVSGIMSVTWHDVAGVIITTDTHRIIYVTHSGVQYDLTPPGGPFVLGTPSSMLFGRAGRTAIPDSHNHRLIIISGILAADRTFINLGDFVPAYCKRFGDSVYVTGHDTNRVIKVRITDDLEWVVTEFNATEITHFDFSKKVSAASGMNFSVLAHHYLENRSTLDFDSTNIYKVIPVKLDYREGPSSSIGTTPTVYRLVGRSILTPIAGPYIKWWVNGTIGADLTDGAYLGVNYRASAAGPHRSFIILGEHAIDYDTFTVPASSYLDHVSAGTFGANFMNLGLAVYVPPVFAEGTYSLPMTINYFGTIYNEFLFSAKHGVLSFDITFPLAGIVPGFAAATTDALVVEPRGIYIDRPIDNTIVAAVTFGTIVGGLVPGVYYEQGIIGEFVYYKWKAIGTDVNPSPNGFVRQTENLSQTGFEFNMVDFSSIAVADNVSNPITSPGPPYAIIISTGPVVGAPGCQVVAVTPYATTVDCYFALNKELYITTPAILYKKYAKIMRGAISYDWSNALFTNTVLPGNAVLSIDTFTNKIIVEGLTNLALIDKNKFIFEFTTQQVSTTYVRGLVAPYFTTPILTNTTTTVTDIVQAVNIVHVTTSFNPVSASTASNLIEVSFADYKKLTVGQKLTSTIFPPPGTDFIVSKFTKTKVYNLTVTPSSSWEGTAVKPPSTIAIDFIATDTPDGTFFLFEILPGPAANKVTVSGPGADFDPDFEVTYPASAMPSFIIPAGTAFNVPMYGEHIKLKIKVVADLIPYALERLESYTVKVSTTVGPPVSLILGNKLPAELVIANSNSTTGISAVPITFPIYYVEVTGTYSVTTGDIFSSEATEFTFSAIPPAIRNDIVAGPITAGLDTIPGNDDDEQVVDVYTITAFNYKTHVIETINNITTPINGGPFTLDITGNFIELDVAQTLPANTPMLFKPTVLHFAIEFEIAFYKGRNFQYIEYNYRGPPRHNNTLLIGLRDDTNAYSYQVTNFAARALIYSHLFGGEFADGIIYNLGPGEFTHIPSGGFVARTPRIYRERVFNETSVRYDIYIDQKIPAIVDLRASVDYGYLRLNDGLYNGSVGIKEGDILSVVVPFGPINQTASSVILSLAQNQFAIPVAPNPQMETKTELVTLLPGYATISNFNISFIVAVTGDYMIPDYFTSAAGGGSELVFELWNGGVFVTSLNRGTYVNLIAGYEVKVNNIFTGYRNYNTVDLIFHGPIIQKISVQTIGVPDLVNYLNFGTLTEPFAHLYRAANIAIEPGYAPVQDLPGSNLGDIPQFLIGGNPAPLPPFIETFASDERHLQVPFYESRSLPVTVTSGALGVPVDLFSAQQNVTFINDQVRTESNNTIALTGNELGLEWDVYSYHSPDAKIYQITLDPLDGSDVYTEIGTWEIVNKSIDVLLLNGLSDSGRSVSRVEMLLGGLGYDRNNITVDFDPPPAGGEKPSAFAVFAPGAAGIIDRVVLTSGGSGYLIPPTVYFLGPFTVPAVATAFLVENTIPHATELKFFNRPDPLKYTLMANAMPESKFYEAPVELDISILPQMFTKETILLKSTTPLKAAVEYSFVTAPQPSYAVFLAETLFSSPLTFQFVKPGNFFTSSSLVQTFQYNILSKQLDFGSVIKGNPILNLLVNNSNVMPQPTLISLAMGNFERNFLATFTTKTNTYEYLNYQRLLPKGTTPFVDIPFTVFGKTNTYEITLQPSEMFGLAESELEKQGDSTKIVFPNEEKPLQISILVPEAPTAEFYYINEFNSQPPAYDLDYFTVLEGFQLNGEFQTTDEYYGSVGFDFDYINVYFGQMPDPEVPSYTTSLPAMPDGQIPIYTELTPKSSDSELFPLQPSFLPPINEEFEQLTLLYSDPADYVFGLNATILEKNTDYIFGPNDLLLLPIDNEFIWQERFMYDLPPEWIYQDKSFRELPPEWIYQDKLFPELPPEWIYQDKLFPELPPEWIYQDKLFPELPAEWIYQDKLFLDIVPQIPDPGNRYIDFPPILGDPGNRYIDFLPEWVYQDKLFVDLIPEIPDPGNRYIDFNPILGDPGNRYIDFNPILGDPGNRYIDFPPELLYQDKLFVDLSPEVLYQSQPLPELIPYRIFDDKIYVEWLPKLEQLNVQYHDNYNLYGAFKTEFLIFADQGRGGDLGQFQGTPPGTPGRTNIPILPYSEFKGSALLKYSPYYGLGGFPTQAGAQVKADKYINATTIQVLVLGFWNYRIHFNNKTFLPRRSRIFPTLWYVRGA